MNEYLYEEQLKNNRFEKLINTKEILTNEEADFVLSWDPTQKSNLHYIKENKILNLKFYYIPSHAIKTPKKVYHV